jgi:hypothetical protein
MRPKPTHANCQRPFVTGWPPTVEARCGHGARGGTVSAQVAASTRLRIRTRLYAPAAKVNS